jgi:hypothetical protein
MRLIILVIIGYFVYTNFFGEESGCEQYVSSYSCDYVEKKAQYEVWYWFNVGEDNPNDDRYIGTTNGLSSCRDLAVSYHRINESFRPWNSRSYICVLMKDGKRMEKHR